MVDGSGAAYSGTVNVAAYWISPAGSGSFPKCRATSASIQMTEFRQLTRMAWWKPVELTRLPAKPLQVATGKATLSCADPPLPSPFQRPGQRCLWHFDRNQKDSGSKKAPPPKTGNTPMLAMSVTSHLELRFTQRLCAVQLYDRWPGRNPVSYAVVKISVVSNPQNQAYGWTDSSGICSGAIPDNASLLMEVFFILPVIVTAVYSQTFTTTNTNVSWQYHHQYLCQFSQSNRHRNRLFPTYAC